MQPLRKPYAPQTSGMRLVDGFVPQRTIVTLPSTRGLIVRAR